MGKIAEADTAATTVLIGKLGAQLPHAEATLQSNDLSLQTYLGSTALFKSTASSYNS